MYLRMVEATVKIDGEEMPGIVYANKILSSLENTPGCVFAGFLHIPLVPHFISVFGDEVLQFGCCDNIALFDWSLYAHLE